MTSMGRMAIVLIVVLGLPSAGWARDEAAPSVESSATISTADTVAAGSVAGGAAPGEGSRREDARGTPTPGGVAPSLVRACVTAEEEEPMTRLPHHWDPRSGYGLCSAVCPQDQACLDGRCVARCVPGCRDGTYCTSDGECLPIPRQVVERPTEEELQRRAGASSADKRQAVLVDMGGVFFLGARPTFEWGAEHAGQIRVYPMNTGIMSYFLEPQSALERFEWGFGASLGYRHYEAHWGNLRGFYWGLGLDYRITEVQDLQEHIATVTQSLKVYGEFGYRWVFGDFLFGFGPTLGFSRPFYSQQRALGPTSCLGEPECGRDQSGRVEGTMVLEVGWFQ